jgi:hypothetical protein
MHYVGNTSVIEQGNFGTCNVAGRFVFNRYARYEDFKLLEEARIKTELIEEL